MTNFTIRAAVVGDLAAVASLNAEVQRLHVANRPDHFKPANVENLLQWFADKLRDQSTTVWIAECGATPIGYVVVQAHDMPETIFCHARRWWELDQIGVARDHRHNGVCRALLQRVIAEARIQRVPHLELQTWAFNEEAQQAFRRLGFAPKRVRFELGVDSENAGDLEL